MLHNRNYTYTSFVVPLLIHKMGEEEGGLFEGESGQ